MPPMLIEEGRFRAQFVRRHDNERSLSISISGREEMNCRVGRQIKRAEMPSPDFPGDEREAGRREVETTRLTRHG